MTVFVCLCVCCAVTVLLQVEIQNDFASGNMPVVIHVDPDTTPCNQDKKNVSEIFTDGMYVCVFVCVLLCDGVVIVSLAQGLRS